MTFEPQDDVRSGDGQKTIDWLIEQMKDGDVFIDIGAHIGWIAIPVILATKPSKIILVEPSNYAAKLLKKNLEDNGIKDFEIIKALVSDKIGKAEYRGGKSPAHGSMFMGEGSVTKPTVTIDSIVEKYKIDKPIVMKMDIELAEPLAWKGMNKCIPLIKAVNMEFMSDKMQENTPFNPKSFVKSIERKGFTIAPVDGLFREDYKWDLCITKNENGKLGDS